MAREAENFNASDMQAGGEGWSLRWAKPLRVHLSVLFVLLLSAISMPLIWLTFQEGRQAALSSAAQQMRMLASGAVHLFESALQDGYAIISLGAVLPSLEAEPPFFIESKREFFVRTLRGSPHLDGIYIGYPGGSFFQVMRAAGNARWREIVGAPTETVFAMQIVRRALRGPALSTWYFLDGNGSQIAASPSREEDFDPRNRPWYQDALEATEAVSTEPYVDASTQALTITLANSMTASRRTVIGVDVMLETVSEMLSGQAVSENALAYVFDEEGKLIVHSDPVVMAGLLHSFSSPPRMGSQLAAKDMTLIPEVAEGHRDKAAEFQVHDDRILPLVRRLLGAGAEIPGGRLTEFEAGGERWLVQITPVGVGAEYLLEGYKVAIAAPVSDFTAESVELLKKKMMIGGLIFLVGIMLALVISRRISRTLVALAADAKQIGDLDLQNWRTTYSLISEINMLSRALTSARDAIRTFAIYVPRELVRQIVASGQLAARTAVRREITVLFTDIRDFTTISEQHAPEEVVDMLAAYFETMNEIVERHNGVIVQYLGDSIYAMWNAPIENADHVSDGCRCALALKSAVDRLNIENRSRGRAELVTRFGLHTGLAVVGSVGARDRRQYTAMGDTVNVASRLEGMNKQFGTTILASAAVKESTGADVGFRPLGLASVKGRKEQIEIFELLEVRKEDGLSRLLQSKDIRPLRL